MVEPNSFDDVIGRLRDGDENAAEEIFERFAGRLIRRARTRMDAQVLRKVDPEDVIQSVFRSFFVRQADDQFELDNWDSMWSLLVRVTLRKCGRRVTALRAKRRDVRREVSLLSSEVESRQQLEAIAREPAPQEVAMLTETMHGLMREFDTKERQVLVMRIQGYTVEEISREIGRAERTVYRVLARARSVLTRMEAE